MISGVSWADAVVAIATAISAPFLVVGIWQSRTALLAQNISFDMQTVLNLWERLDHHWCRFLQAKGESEKQFEFGQLSGYYELACGLFRDDVLTTKAARTLREHLRDILPKMKAHPDFAARFESLRSDPQTFENIGWFCDSQLA